MSLVVRFDAYGGPDGLYLADEDVPVPTPGQVRVRQHVIGVNPADLRLLAGEFGRDRPLPAVLGFEASGVIDAVGPEVNDLAAGTPVVWHGIGAQRELALVRAERVYPLPEHVALDQAAILPVAAVTAFSALIQLGITEHSVILIHGAGGGVGSAAIQIARELGARVVGTASAASQDYLHLLGARPLVYGPDLALQVGNLPDGLSTIDAVLDLVGTPQTIAATVAVLGGRPGIPLSADTDRAVTVVPSAASQAAGIRDLTVAKGALREALALADAGLLHTEIAQRFPLSHAAQALRSLSGHARGKTVLITGASS